MQNEFERRAAISSSSKAHKNKKRSIRQVCEAIAVIAACVVLGALIVYCIVMLCVYGYDIGRTIELMAWIFLLLMLAVFVVVRYLAAKIKERKTLIADALKRSAQALSNVNLRYDNINEITAVMDVLGMVTEEPRTRAERKAMIERLKQFVKADSIELPQTAETAAILDSLPAPDTPTALAAALSAGATLRQAEDGQTLVLTTITGGKNILLTPVQTADGVILCQQGVRLRSELAPDIERLGLMSMPTSPEFFEGQPLEKNVIYPELPQPAERLGPELLSPNAQSVGHAVLPRQLSTPIPVMNRIDAPNDEMDAIRKALPVSDNGTDNGALKTESDPLPEEERLKITEYKAAHAKPKAPKKERTQEQKDRAKANAARRKAEREEFLNSLSPEERERHIAEQKLKKSKAAETRKKKNVASDGNSSGKPN